MENKGKESFCLIVVYIFCLSAMFMCSGCLSGGDESSVQRLAPIKKVSKKGLEEKRRGFRKLKDMLVSTDTFEYDPSNRRDPFKSLVLGMRVKKGEGEKAKPKTPLQLVDLSSIVLKGIVWGNYAKRAMVVTPEGKSFIIKKNTPIGKNGGKVKKITRDSVIVEEKFRDYTGSLKSKSIVLKLRKKEG